MLGLLRFTRRTGCALNSSLTQRIQLGMGQRYSSSIIAEAERAATDENATFVSKLQNSFNEDLRNGHVVPVYKKALLYGDRPAIKDDQGQYSYMQLFRSAKRLSFQLSNLCGSGSSSRVAFLSNNSAIFTVVQWACWFSGQIGKCFETILIYCYLLIGP